MKSDKEITVYIYNGLVTIDIPKKGVMPDKATIHRIWEAIQDAKKEVPRR